MESRSDRKMKTRTNLMQSALRQVAEGQPFAAISIREVARGAEVVPTAFYRHFRDMDDLGLCLVDELSLVLRQMLRQARQSERSAQQMVEDSLTLVFDYALANRGFFLFMGQNLTSGAPTLRRAIRSELSYFAHELGLDLRRLGLLRELSEAKLDEVCRFAIQAMVVGVVDLLDVETGDLTGREALRRRMACQLRLIFVGAAHWCQAVNPHGSP